MGLLYTNYNSTNNNTLKINACSGGIYKTYKESWFLRFNLKSNLADILFRKEGIYYSSIEDRYDIRKYNRNEPKEVLLLQMIICGDMEVIAEVILKEDFENNLKIPIKKEIEYEESN